MRAEEDEVLHSLEALQDILTAIPYPVFVKDEKHRWVLVNDAFCKMMGHPAEELLYKSDYDFIPAAQADVFWAIDDQVFATGEPNENEEVITDASGGVRVITTRKCRVELPVAGGREHFIVATFSDVTLYREAEARARYLAQHDALTGLANRMQLGERLKAALHDAQGRDGQLAVLMLDLDGFKNVNDRYGHHAGDDLLQEMASRLKQLMTQPGIVARLGGDEFCIVLPAAGDRAAVGALAERAIAAISTPVVREWGTAEVSTSIGIAHFPEDGTSEDQLLKAADLALYTAKASGRGVFKHFERGMERRSEGREGLALALAAAVEAGKIAMSFQPLISTRDGAVRAMEAVPEWRHPKLGLVPASVFVPMAERHGIAGALGRLILERACAAAVGWTDPLPVRVNIPAAVLESSTLIPTIQAALAKTGLAAARLEVEVTEAATLRAGAKAPEIFGDLKSLGVKVAIVDFGSGWASLDLLRRIPFDRLKIDRSFVKNMEADPRSAAIVRAVLSIGKALDVAVTAEGVERPEQVEALKTMGCDEVQGRHVDAQSAYARKMAAGR